MISDKEMRKRIEDMSPQELLKASETFEALFDLVHQHDDNSIANTNTQNNVLNARIVQLEAEIARRDAELLELNDKAVFIKFENEDELPAEIKDDVYSAMFECSHVDGVRLFPYIEENGQKYFLVMLKEVV